MRNFKHHAIAIVSICIIIFAVYSLMPEDQPAQAPAAASSDHVIQIYSATWGGNCDKTIDQILRDRQSKPLPTDDKGNVIPQPALVHAKLNNALQTITDLCNGKPSCDVTPTTDILGVAPMEDCSKNLNIGYRCSNFDKLQTVSIDQDRTTTIDCTTDASAPTPTK